MRTMRIVFILLALCIVFSVFSCTPEDAGKQEPENEASDVAAPEAEAEGELTDEALVATGVELGGALAGGGTEKDGVLTPVDSENGDDGEQVGSTDESEDDDVERVESPVTMDDLVYPTYDKETKTTSKKSVGDTDSWNLITTDPMDTVWGYYQQILEGWELKIDSKLEEEEGNRSVSAVFEDGGNVFTVELTQNGPNNFTRIKITKEASSG